MPNFIIISFKENYQIPIILTDILLEGSQLLYVGEDEIIRQAFHVNPINNIMLLQSL